MVLPNIDLDLDIVNGNGADTRPSEVIKLVPMTGTELAALVAPLLRDGHPAVFHLLRLRQFHERLKLFDYHTPSPSHCAALGLSADALLALVAYLLRRSRRIDSASDTDSDDDRLIRSVSSRILAQLRTREDGKLAMMAAYARLLTESGGDSDIGDRGERRLRIATAATSDMTDAHYHTDAEIAGLLSLLQCSLSDRWSFVRRSFAEALARILPRLSETSTDKLVTQLRSTLDTDTASGNDSDSGWQSQEGSFLALIAILQYSEHRSLVMHLVPDLVLRFASHRQLSVREATIKLFGKWIKALENSNTRSDSCSGSAVMVLDQCWAALTNDAASSISEPQGLIDALTLLLPSALIDTADIQSRFSALAALIDRYTGHHHSVVRQSCAALIHAISGVSASLRASVLGAIIDRWSNASHDFDANSQQSLQLCTIEEDGTGGEYEHGFDIPPPITDIKQSSSIATAILPWQWREGALMAVELIIVDDFHHASTYNTDEDTIDVPTLVSLLSIVSPCAASPRWELRRMTNQTIRPLILTLALQDFHCLTNIIDQLLTVGDTDTTIDQLPIISGAFYVNVLTTFSLDVELSGIPISARSSDPEAIEHEHQLLSQHIRPIRLSILQQLTSVCAGWMAKLNSAGMMALVEPDRFAPSSLAFAFTEHVWMMASASIIHLCAALARTSHQSIPQCEPSLIAKVFEAFNELSHSDEQRVAAGRAESMWIRITDASIQSVAWSLQSTAARSGAAAAACVEWLVRRSTRTANQIQLLFAIMPMLRSLSQSQSSVACTVKLSLKIFTAPSPPLTVAQCQSLVEYWLALVKDSRLSDAQTIHIDQAIQQKLATLASTKATVASTTGENDWDATESDEDSWDAADDGDDVGNSDSDESSATLQYLTQALASLRSLTAHRPLPLLTAV